MSASSRNTPRARAGAVLPLVAALLAGCTAGEGDPAAPPSPPVDASPAPAPSGPTPAPSATPGDRAWATCTATRAALRVSYPAGWVARDHPSGGCAYFDPEPFGVEVGTEAPPVAVRLDVEDVAYDRVREGYLRGEVDAQRDAEVAGYPAVRVEDRSTGGPLGPKGRRLTYLADLGDGRTLVLTTNETDAADPADAREVLDRMAELLERAGTASGDPSPR